MRCRAGPRRAPVGRWRFSVSTRVMGAGRAVVEALEAEGVDRIYCLPGSHVLEIYDALAECPAITLVTCKLEGSISLMADVQGRLTGGPGVCLVTAGPGAANSLPGVAQAYTAASPLVPVVGAGLPGGWSPSPFSPPAPFTWPGAPAPGPCTSRSRARATPAAISFRGG